MSTTRTEELPATPPEVAGRIARHSWHGYLTLDNIAAVVDRIDNMLAGRHYAFAIQREHDHGAYRPELRTGCQVDGPARRSLSTLDDGQRVAHANWEDGERVWGIDTTTATQREANEISQRYRDAPEDRDAVSAYRSLVHVAFEGDRVTVKQFNGPGELGTWTIAIEDHTDYQTWIEETNDPVWGGPLPEEIRVRVGPLARQEGVYGVQVRARAGQATAVSALADPDLIEKYARALLVAAEQVRQANKRAARK